MIDGPSLIVPSSSQFNPPCPIRSDPARTLFCLSYAALWCALSSHGWQRTEYQGERIIDGQTYHQALIGSYGVFDVQFEQTGGPITVPYKTWSLAQTNPAAYPLAVAVAACISLAAVSGALLCLCHLRSVCTRSRDVQQAFTKRAAYAAIPQCFFAAAGVVAWRCLPGDAFNVFCTRDGCVQEAASGVRALSVWYAWVFALVSAVVSLFLALTLWRLAHYDDAAEQGEEVEVPLAGVNGGGVGIIHVPHPSQPHRTLSKGSSPAVMGAAGPSPRNPAEAWNPQPHQYAPVGGSPGKGGAAANPSWLTPGV